jgi:hypothetical protein
MALMGKYVYCFIKERDKTSFGISGLGGFNAPVYTINYEDVSAVVSEAPITGFTPSSQNTGAHQGVLRRVMERYTVVPVAFGTVSKNRKEVEAFIKANYRQFLANIRFLQDKVEIRLRITFKDIIADGEAPSVTGKLQKSRLRILEPLERIAAASRVKEENTSRTTMNMFFLVDKAEIDYFRQQVQEIACSYPNDFQFSCTGPWSPYNFVNMDIDTD